MGYSIFVPPYRRPCSDSDMLRRLKYCRIIILIIIIIIIVIIIISIIIIDTPLLRTKCLTHAPARLS